MAPPLRFIPFRIAPPEPPKWQQLVTAKAVASALGVDRTTVYRWVKNGRISRGVFLNTPRPRFDLDVVVAELRELEAREARRVL